jgi:hypothetical protein
MIGLLRDEKLRWKLAGEFGADAAAGVEKSVSRKSQGVKYPPNHSFSTQPFALLTYFLI